MNKWLWYFLVVIALGLLIISLLTGKFVLSLFALVLTLFLKRYYHKIPLPAVYTKHKIYSSVKGKIYDPSTFEQQKKSMKR